MSIGNSFYLLTILQKAPSMTGPEHASDSSSVFLNHDFGLVCYLNVNWVYKFFVD